MDGSSLVLVALLALFAVRLFHVFPSEYRYAAGRMPWGEDQARRGALAHQRCYTAPLLVMFAGGALPSILDIAWPLAGFIQLSPFVISPVLWLWLRHFGPDRDLIDTYLDALVVRQPTPVPPPPPE